MSVRKSIHSSRARSLIWLMLLCLFVGLASAADVDLDDDDIDDDMYVPPALRITVTDNLAALAEKSRLKNVPILLMFASEDCEFCARLENEVLGPLKLSGVDPQRVILRKVLMEDYEMLNDFQGNELSGETFAMQHDVQVTPTIALVNAEGVELVPKIIGYQTPGIYDAYLEKAIDVSRQLLEK